MDVLRSVLCDLQPLTKESSEMNNTATLCVSFMVVDADM